MQHFRRIRLQHSPNGGYDCAVPPGITPPVDYWQPDVVVTVAGIYWRVTYNGKWDLRYKPVHIRDGARNYLQGGELMFPCDESVAEWDAEVAAQVEKYNAAL